MSAAMNRVCISLGPVGTVIMFVGLASAGLLVAPSPDALLTTCIGNRQAVRAGLMVTILGGVFYLPWMVMLARSFQPGERHRPGFAFLKLVFGATLTILIGLPYLLVEAAVYRPDTPAAVVRGVVDVARMLAEGFGYIHVIAVLWTGLLMLRDHRMLSVLPRWLGWLNLVCALLLVPAVFADTISSGLFGWKGVVAFDFPSLAFLPWYFAWTCALLRVGQRGRSKRSQGAI